MRREQLLTACLWLAVVGLSTWVGGTLYQMVVVVPIWSASPPESVRAFFLGTSYNQTIFNFFGPPFMAARTLPVVVALVAGWHLPRHRRALLLATSSLLLAVAYTLFHVYPINAVLFAQAGGTLSEMQVQAMTSAWILADRLRFGVGLVAFVAVLHAFRLPIEGRKGG